MKHSRILPAEADDAKIAARLLYDTDPHIFDCLFDPHPEGMFGILERQWCEPRGIFSHSLARAAVHDGAMLGIELGFSAGELADHRRNTSRLFLDMLPPDLLSHMAAVMPYVNFIVPAIPKDAYYVQYLSVLPEARGKAIGAKLLMEAFEQAKKWGFQSCHLDVDGTSAAVRFYRRMGMEAVVETRVPLLEERWDIPPHLRMVRPLI